MVAHNIVDSPEGFVADHFIIPRFSIEAILEATEEIAIKMIRGNMYVSSYWLESSITIIRVKSSDPRFGFVGKHKVFLESVASQIGIYLETEPAKRQYPCALSPKQRAYAVNPMMDHADQVLALLRMQCAGRFQSKS